MILDARAPKALDNRALTDRVYEVLRSRIITLQLAPGERLRLEEQAR
jgi:DNA-binding GntR family transcriptional regulator